MLCINMEINENWEETKMAHVIVIRKHSNEIVTFGVYLVDLCDKGLKESYANVNVSYAS